MSQEFDRAAFKNTSGQAVEQTSSFGLDRALFGRVAARRAFLFNQALGKFILEQRQVKRREFIGGFFDKYDAQMKTITNAVWPWQDTPKKDPEKIELVHTYLHHIYIDFEVDRFIGWHTEYERVSDTHDEPHVVGGYAKENIFYDKFPMASRVSLGIVLSGEEPRPGWRPDLTDTQVREMRDEWILSDPRVEIFFKWEEQVFSGEKDRVLNSRPEFPKLNSTKVGHIVVVKDLNDAEAINKGLIECLFVFDRFRDDIIRDSIESKRK